MFYDVGALETRFGERSVAKTNFSQESTFVELGIFFSFLLVTSGALGMGLNFILYHGFPSRGPDPKHAPAGG